MATDATLENGKRRKHSEYESDLSMESEERGTGGKLIGWRA
jgi:hypothetical protein